MKTANVNRDTVEVRITRHLRDTAKAVLVEVTDTGTEVWFPRSHVVSVDMMDDGTGLIEVTRWIAKAKGLIE